MVDGRRHDLEGGYVLREVNDRPSRVSRTEIAFAISTYDHTRPLIIDPVLTYSTYLGGTGDDQGNAIAVDSAGNAYVTGQTASTNFPVAPVVFLCRPGICAYQRNYGGGGSDAFVAKFGPTGSRIYSTYLGGNDDDIGRGIAVDGSGQAYITGSTDSTDFPIKAAAGTAAPFDSNYNGRRDAFISKLSANGTTLVFSTFIGGGGIDVGMAIAVESGATPRVFVAGLSDSPAISGFSANCIGSCVGRDAFAARLAADGASLQQFIFVGGSDIDRATALAIDGSANMYLTGDTRSSDFPTHTPFQATYRGPFTFSSDDTLGGDVIVLKLSAVDGTLMYGSYLGGSFIEVGQGISVDTLGQAVIVGDTKSGDFPKVNPLQFTLRGARDFFVAKVNASGSALMFSTFLGGSVEESSRGVALDNSQNIYLLGATTSDDFPVTPDAFRTQAFIRDHTVTGDTKLSLVGDIVLAKLAPMGTSVLYGTYFGGGVAIGDDRENDGLGLAADSAGTIYMTGLASTTDFPVAQPFQATLAGDTDAFVAKLGATCGVGSADLRVTQTDTPDPFNYMNRQTQDLVYTIAVANLGSATATGVRLYDLLPEDVTFKSASPTQGSCTPGNQINPLMTCDLGTITSGSTATVMITASVHGRPILKNWAHAVSTQCDPNPANNAEVETTTVSSVQVVLFTLNVNVIYVKDPKPIVFSVNRNGISCVSDCSHDYQSGSVVQLSFPDTSIGGSVFNLTGGNRDCRDGILIMTGDRTCNYYYDEDKQFKDEDFGGNFGASVDVGQSTVLPFFSEMQNPSSTGAVDLVLTASPPFRIEGPSTFHLGPGQLLREIGEGVRLRFTPIQPGPVIGNLRFSWSGPGATPSFQTIPHFTAVGAGIGVKAIAVQVNGNGSVTGAGQVISCGTTSEGSSLTDCVEATTSATPPAITLTATANHGWAFYGWNGCTPTSVTQCTATAPTTVTATFRPLPTKLPPPDRPKLPTRQ